MLPFDVYEHPEFVYQSDAKGKQPALYVVGVGLVAIGGALATYQYAPERISTVLKQLGLKE